MRIVSKGALAVAFGAVSLVAIGLMALAAPFADPPKPTPGPARPIQEAQAIIEASNARHVQFLKDFVASRRDPRSLPRLSIEATGDVPRSLEAAVPAAQLVARASVIHTAFTSGRDGFPVTTSTLRLTEVVKAPGAQSVGAEIRVLQVGGPVPQPKPMDAGLAQLIIDELLLTGDDVIILANFRADLGVFQPLSAAGIYFIQNGRIVPEESNRFGSTVAGASPSLLLAKMRQYGP